MMDSEQVMRAANRMNDAAVEMSRAASTIDGATHRLDQVLTQSAYQFQELVERLEKAWKVRDEQ
jgi:methyl-accepting chemotaxis protein